MKEISLIISTTDEMCSFANNFFDINEAEKLKEFAEKLGYTVVVEETAERFCDELNPLRKKMVRDIDWSNYNNILYVIKNREKNDVDIVRGLASEGSGLSITIKRGQIMTEYSTFLELEGKNVSEEKIIEFCKQIASKFFTSDNKVADYIENMQKKGCKVTEDSSFPECKDGFHKGCLICPYNKEAGNFIKNDIDIDRFNLVLEEKFE